MTSNLEIGPEHVIAALDSRTLGIEARLAAARTSGDQSMIGRCKRALNPDPMTGLLDESAVRSWLDAVAMEQLMTGGGL